MATTMKKPAQLSPAFEDLWGDEPQTEPQVGTQEEAAEEVTAATDATDPGDREEQENGQDSGEAEPAQDADEAVADPGETETIDQHAAEPANEDVAETGTEPPAEKARDITPEQQAEIDFAEQKKEAEDNFIELAIDRARLEVALKTAKKLEKDALEELSELIDRGPQRPISRPLSPPPPPQRTAQSSTAEATDVAPDSGQVVSTAPAASPEPENTAWRDVSVSQLGLKPSLETLLIDTHNIATIGQLVDLQTKIGDRREDWPKGIGEAKITQIEDAMTAWLTKNRDRTNDSRNVPVTVVDETVGQDGEPAATESGTGHADIDAANEEWEAMTTEQQCEWLNARCVQVDSDVLDDLDLREADNELVWHEGVVAYEEGDQAGNCPYGPGVDCDAWLQGWLWKGKQDTSDVESPNTVAETNNETSDEE